MNALVVNVFRAMMFLSVALLVVGIFKPEWLRFRHIQPGRTTIVAVAIGLLLIGFIGTGAVQDAGRNDPEAVSRGKLLGQAVYVVNDSMRRCEPGAKSGDAGASNDEKTPTGIRYMVKTPVNYNSTIAHPLLMVYAPGGEIDMSRKNTCTSRKRPRRQVLLSRMPITDK